MPRLRDIIGIDLRALAVFRIGAGVLILCDLINRSCSLVAHYTDSGLLPRDALLENFSEFSYLSIHLVGGGAIFQGFLLATAAVFAIGLLIGYRTRVMTIASWILLISLQNRNPMILQGGDILLRVLMFWAIFLPLGAIYSVDSALSTNPTKGKQIVSVATLAILLQVAMVYFFGALLKSGAPWIPDGTATQMALQIDQFVTPFGVLTREFLAKYSVIGKYLTYYVYYLELLAPILLFLPIFFVSIRILLVTALVGMHLGFTLMMELGLFPWIDIVSLLLFLPKEFWDRIANLRPLWTRSQFVLYYDGRCDFCKKSVHLIKTFLLLDQMELKEATGSKKELMKKSRSWILMGSGKKASTQFEVFQKLIMSSPLTWPLAKIFQLSWISKAGKYAYQKISGKRHRMGPLTKRFLPFRESTFRLSYFGNAVVVFFLGVTLWWNIGNQLNSYLGMPDPVIKLVEVTRMDQKWNMFAPYPQRYHGWYVIVGKLENGKSVDVYNEIEREPSWQKPERVSSTFSSQRWRKFMMNLSKDRDKRDRRLYARYLCRKWNGPEKPEARHLKELRIYFMRKMTRFDLTVTEPFKKHFLHHDCLSDS